MLGQKPGAISILKISSFFRLASRKKAKTSSRSFEITSFPSGQVARTRIVCTVPRYSTLFAQRFRSDTERGAAPRSCLCRLVGLFFHFTKWRASHVATPMEKAITIHKRTLSRNERGTCSCESQPSGSWIGSPFGLSDSLLTFFSPTFEISHGRLRPLAVATGSALVSTGGFDPADLNNRFNRRELRNVGHHLGGVWRCRSLERFE
jgi:hypothetical protein